MPVFLARRTALLLSLSALAACGDPEADQRRAFITFLQQRVLDRSGLHVPRPSADQVKSWGDYAKDYAIITDFHDGLSQNISKPMEEAAQRGAVRSIQDLMDRRNDVAEVKSGMATLAVELDRRVAIADAAHAALHQPADLKKVYDEAYAREVTAPVEAIRGMFPIAAASLGAALSLADYIAQHRAVVKVTGAVVQVSDPAVQRELGTRMNTMNAAGQEALAAQQRLRRAVSGE